MNLGNGPFAETENEDLLRWTQTWKLLKRSTRPQIELWLKTQAGNAENDMRRRLNVMKANRLKAGKRCR